MLKLRWFFCLIGFLFLLLLHPFFICFLILLEFLLLLDDFGHVVVDLLFDELNRFAVLLTAYFYDDILFLFGVRNPEFDWSECRGGEYLGWHPVYEEFGVDIVLPEVHEIVGRNHLLVHESGEDGRIGVPDLEACDRSDVPEYCSAHRVGHLLDELVRHHEIELVFPRFR